MIESHEEAVMSKIKEYRERHKLSQEELARKLGLDRSSVAKWESGRNKPRLNHLLDMTKIFNCSLDELVVGGKEMAVSKSVNCPHCGRKLNSYTVDTTSTQRTSGMCPSCGKRYTVEYDKGKIKVSKN